MGVYKCFLELILGGGRGWGNKIEGGDNMKVE